MERAASDLFRRSPDVLAAYAFGSRVEGDSHSESDLDLAVLLDWAQVPERAARGERQIELIRDLLDALGMNAIDLVVLNDAPPLLARHIIRSGLLLHATSAKTVHSLTRDVQLLAADLEPFVRRGRARLLDTLGA